MSIGILKKPPLFTFSYTIFNNYGFCAALKFHWKIYSTKTLSFQISSQIVKFWTFKTSCKYILWLSYTLRESVKINIKFLLKVLKIIFADKVIIRTRQKQTKKITTIVADHMRNFKSNITINFTQ